MSDKLAKIKTYIEEKLDELSSEIDEIDERFEEGFDPMDWSGGNFDDAYSLGEEDGETRGSYRVLSKIKRILEEAV
ncbi:hypothetical protein [Cytobacillus solani]|uniref:Uncharacterized protein n=1 Tax=Cytobacillus solani TaxID=1637975 RepID=A0A0Q3VGY8_9BACI|nr:hypothetical protein [Cytobacillus solani]KQL18827.1 hypothetical protein AN957_09745 [Cytobacillus solani]